jgi:hypothetical protein
VGRRRLVIGAIFKNIDLGQKETVVGDNQGWGTQKGCFY